MDRDSILRVIKSRPISPHTWVAAMPVAAMLITAQARIRRFGCCRPISGTRLVLESDAVSAGLEAHGPKDAQKFVLEVIWCGYFKGRLELLPQF